MLLALTGLVAFIGGGALLWQQQTAPQPQQPREWPFYIGTPTVTPPPEIAFFPAPDATEVPHFDMPHIEQIATADVLAPALLAEYEGRYEDAAGIYRDVAASSTGTELGAEAQWHLGVVLFNAGLYDDSIAEFRVFATTYPADSRAGRAVFWAAQGHAAAGRPAEARAEFESYAPVGGPLQVMALLLASDQAADEGRPEVQRALIEQALAASTTRLDRVQALERKATLDWSEDRDSAAGDAFMQIAAESRVPFYRAAMLLNAARAYYEAAQTAPAEAAILELVNSLPDEADAYAGLLLLLENDPNTLESGKIGYDLACHIAVGASQYQVALNNCEAFRARVEPGPARVEAAWYTALAYEGLDNIEEAGEWYKAFAEVYPADERADDALLAWGELLMDEGDNEAALAAFGQLVGTYPASPLAASAHDNAAVINRRLGNLDVAAEQWRLAAEAATEDSEKARALFWRGWALQQQGQVDAAAATWGEGAQYSTFWGFRSADHLDPALVVPQNPGAATSEALMAADLPAADSPEEQALFDWIAGWSTGGVTRATTAREVLVQSPEYSRALALCRVQLWPEAGSQFDSLIAELSEAGDDAGLATLMLETAREGWHWYSYRAALALRTRAEESGVTGQTSSLHNALLRGLYPVAWPQVLLRETRERDLSPWLTLAMMRQESAFDPRAHSWADARGLTQVIPGTADAIAIDLAVPNFQQSDLFRPATAIRFGVFYLNQTIDNFDGNILHALAGYNGGPGNIARWAGGRANGDIDLFIENIDYPETADYVERVYSNYRMYRLTYGP